MDQRLNNANSPVSPFLYENSDEIRSVSSPKQICRRPGDRLRSAESSVNVLTPLSGVARPPAGLISPQQPLSVFTGRISFGENQVENQHLPVGSPMLISPVPRAGCSAATICLDSKVKDALFKSDQQPNLIGDFTSCHALPLISGQHPDLKTISVQTLASLISGEFSETVQEHIVVDCRYPYEYDGGHIRGAVNIYTREGLMEKFFNENANADSGTSKRKVIIFHCEFSSKRGPKLYRFTRSQDRQHNSANYPHLTYPELYLLEGGYKAFYESYSHLCQPHAYFPMEADKEALVKFQSLRSKSWVKKSDRSRNAPALRGHKRSTLGIRSLGLSPDSPAP